MQGSDLHGAGRKAGVVSRLAALFGATAQGRQPRRHGWLNPVQRAGEIVCGLLVTVLFTGAFAILGSSARTIALAAMSAGAAWSMVCAVLFLRRSRLAGVQRKQLQADLLQASTPDLFAQRLERELPAGLLGDLRPHEVHRMKTVVRESAQAEPSGLTTLLRAAAVLLLVLAGTLPAALPLLWIDDAESSLRLAHGIAIGLLFVLGGFLGHHAGLRPVLLGSCLAGLGALLAGPSWVL
ncbi:hypothetical protein M8A51_20975 [Schlegelella sp. S2-27]|uniref:VIT family protein n=1 Tax=Caldimonas mangrovi TaxID=2944811 RepID=A0ABT0YUM7_9BURK|nr:hypothetical protein [Caldimonas mangrovi]MCM5682009.1 hypothetical protein [Caldimonas mangrovi]